MNYEKEISISRATARKVVDHMPEYEIQGEDAKPIPVANFFAALLDALDAGQAATPATIAIVITGTDME